MSKKNKHAEPVPPTAEEESSSVTQDVTSAEARPDSISEEVLQDLKDKAAKADENWDKYLRAVADLDNYRKRVGRDPENPQNP